MKIYKYKEIVTKEDKVLLLGPGLPNNFGGMFNYILLWLDEINLFTKNNNLLVKEDFPIDQSIKVKKRKIRSDKNIRMVKLLSILGIVLSVRILSCFFRSDYKNIISNYSVIHILTDSLVTFSLVKVLFFFNKDLKVVYTLHDPKSHKEKISFLGKKIKEYNLRKLYLLSSSRKNFYLHIHSEKLIVDCPNHVRNIIIHPHPLPKKIINNKYVKKNNKLRFGFLGRIEYYKGLDIMFDAFKSIEDSLGANVEIIIVGRGNLDKEKWENQLNCDVFIKNEIVTDKYFHQQMNSLDCLLLPYKKASQSGVGYMALAYNIPIIATATGGLPDIINQSSKKKSKLIPPNNTEKLAEAIKSFLE